MNILDIIILVCFVPAVIKGITKGLTIQLTSLVALLLGPWLAYHFSDTTATWLQPYIPLSAQWLHIISFSIIVIVAIILLSILGNLLSRIFKLVMLGWLDKLLGSIFAMVKLFLILGLVIVLFESFNSRIGLIDQEWLSQSALYGPFKDAALHIFPYLKSFVVNAASEIHV